MGARLGGAVTPFAVAAVACIGALALPASSLAARPPRLTGEQLTATADGSSYFVPGTCYSGGPADSSFSFTGTATGPFPGTYTETGTLSYTLTTVSSGEEVATGPVTGFSATVTITSPAGTVIVKERFDPSLSADRDGHCYESAGGTSFATDSLGPVFTATIGTARGTFRDHGVAADTLSSEIALGGSVSESDETAALTSTAPACDRAKSASRHHERHRTQRASPRRGRHGSEGARLMVAASVYERSASSSA